MKVLLADSPKVCSALRLLLEQKTEMDVVGEVYDVKKLLAQVEAARPGLLLLGWELPGKPSDGLLATLRALSPGLKVLALSGRPEARQLALRAGVDAFVNKGDPPDRLLAALQAVGIEIAGVEYI